MPLSQVQGGTSCFYFFLRPSAFRMLQSRVLQLHLTFDHCPTSSIPLKTLSWVFVSYYSANRLSLISWGTPFFFFFFLIPQPPHPREQRSCGCGDLEFPPCEWRGSAAGHFHLGVLGVRSYFSSFALQGSRFASCWAFYKTYFFSSLNLLRRSGLRGMSTCSYS